MSGYARINDILETCVEISQCIGRVKQSAHTAMEKLVQSDKVQASLVEARLSAIADLPDAYEWYRKKIKDKKINRIVMLRHMDHAEAALRPAVDLESSFEAFLLQNAAQSQKCTSVVDADIESTSVVDADIQSLQVNLAMLTGGKGRNSRSTKSQPPKRGEKGHQHGVTPRKPPPPSVDELPKCTSVAWKQFPEIPAPAVETLPEPPLVAQKQLSETCLQISQQTLRLRQSFDSARETLCPTDKVKAKLLDDRLSAIVKLPDAYDWYSRAIEGKHMDRSVMLRHVANAESALRPAVDLQSSLQCFLLDDSLMLQKSTSIVDTDIECLELNLAMLTGGGAGKTTTTQTKQATQHGVTSPIAGATQWGLRQPELVGVQRRKQPKRKAKQDPVPVCRKSQRARRPSAKLREG